jgi:DNA-binding beta-propeller fold protein YncE
MNSLVKATTLFTGILIICAFGTITNSPVSVAAPGLKIVQRWDLPVVLKEVSGIASIDSIRFACIQDEVGSIFIYNIATSTIQEEIPFAPAGDYEGITLVNDTAWIIRADGKLFQVSTLYSKATAITEYTTPLTVNHNVEGLCYDKINNRLLLAIKNAEPGGKTYKGIYAFDLATKKMAAEPVFKIEMRQELKTGNKKRSFEIMPSGIAIHPQTKDMYITDGRNSMLLILDAAGGFKNLFDLNSKDFHQPEGITFHTTGEMFISNEGAKGGGNILKVEPVQ